ncbi:hypothetical protein GGS21DRAFT_437924 [Xylaria nigripes]|nr:hypothetical protein GGS21DRAFT_437924 [Xylaria nigripes]
MIAPLVALKKRTRTRIRTRTRTRHRLRTHLPLKQRIRLKEQRSVTGPANMEPSTLTTKSAIISANMTTSSPIPADDVMTPHGLVAHVEGMCSWSDEQESDKPVTLQPKVPFHIRADPFVNSNDDRFIKMENYFFSLLRTPGLTIDHILEATFDDHEITLITPQPGPSDVIDWQRRNSRSYHENLETRFKGRTNTLSFKMACLYFGFPVEPLRVGPMSLLFPAERNVLQRQASPPIDPLDFLRQHNYDSNFIHNASVLSLRGGGSIHAFLDEKEDSEDDDSGDNDAITWVPSVQGRKPQKREQTAPLGVEDVYSPAVQELPAEDYPMDLVWDSNSTIPFNSNKEIRLYGWQGVMSTPLKYERFVAQVDRLISNWEHDDRSICVEIWDAPLFKLVKMVTGTIQHAHGDSVPDIDPIWEVMLEYFGSAQSNKYVCFIHSEDEDHSSKTNRHTTYEPMSTDRYIVRIENANGEVAYMRVPSGLGQEHQSHQFSHEYTRAMQVLMYPDAPHSWVSYQQGLIGDAYQYLDPPDGLWKQVIQKSMSYEADDRPAHPTISFKLVPINDDVVPVVIPGVFNSTRLPGLNRRNFNSTNTSGASEALSKLRQVIESAMTTTDFINQCKGLEIWCPASHFKDTAKQPIRIALSGDTTISTFTKDWHKVLKTGVVPSKPFGLVVRPVYKAYRIGKPSGSKMNFEIMESTLERFKAFVRDRIHNDYIHESSSHVLFLEPSDGRSYQPDFTIRQETTEEEWQWILRNIIEPELVVTVERADNEWVIAKDSIWGPRYVARNVLALDSTKQRSTPQRFRSRGDISPPFEGAEYVSGHAFSASATGTNKPTANLGSLDFLFKNSNNTMSEATRMRMLRNRSFTGALSIFTNPLKPVMPLHGTPLESIIKTGPSMPGVSIAMMTPTEMLRLQREVHSLRFQLLDRTRECPYADCDLYFTFSDTEGLDRHIREDHAVLRCFLCDKDKHLLPQYNLDQIKKHFVSEHLNDILQAYGGKSNSTFASEYKPEKRCRHFNTCGTVTSYMTGDQLAAHMRFHEDYPRPRAARDRFTENDELSEPEEVKRTGDELNQQGYRLNQDSLDDWDSGSLSSLSLSPLPKTLKINTEHQSTFQTSAPGPTPLPTPAHNSIMTAPSNLSSARATRRQSATTVVPNPFPTIPLSHTLNTSQDVASTTTDQNRLDSLETDHQISETTASFGNLDKTSFTTLRQLSPTADSDAGENKRKRRRPADLDTTYRKKRASATSSSGDEDMEYEYSERSAVTDPPTNIEMNPVVEGQEKEGEGAEGDPNPAPRKKRIGKKTTSSKTNTPTPLPQPTSANASEPKPETKSASTPGPMVTRTGRAVRATRAARDSANYAEIASPSGNDGKPKRRGRARTKTAKSESNQEHQVKTSGRRAKA